MDSGLPSNLFALTKKLCFFGHRCVRLRLLWLQYLLAILKPLSQKPRPRGFALPHRQESPYTRALDSRAYISMTWLRGRLRFSIRHSQPLLRSRCLLRSRGTQYETE